MTTHSDKPVAHLIDADFYSFRQSKAHKLINNVSSDNFMSGRNTWFEYQFKDPVYISRIELEFSNYDSWNDVIFELQYVDGSPKEEKCKFNSNPLVLSPKRLVSKISFKPEAKNFSKPTLNSLRVYGFTGEEFKKFEGFVADYDRRMSELLEKEQLKTELESGVKSRQERIEQLNREIGQSKAELAKISSDIEASKNNFSERQDDLASIKTAISGDRKIQASLLKEIKDAQKELNELKEELRIFPSEISGFVREGNRNIFWYVILSIPFVIILSIILRSLFSSAIDLTQLWKSEDVDVWVIFLTRLPFVIVAITLIEACGYIIGRLFFEIVRINRQRLEFSKLSIIAKDVTTAAASKSEIDDTAQFEAETELRMNLLREHMKSYNEGDFSYQGSALTGAIVAVAAKIVGDRSSPT
ncbi:hypothetical protein B9057_09545 [Aestuarium zhoushanense]|nr:hypothetical protein B9057_09545 [Aestuarium zhoushanense]